MGVTKIPGAIVPKMIQKIPQVWGIFIGFGLDKTKAPDAEHQATLVEN